MTAFTRFYENFADARDSCKQACDAIDSCVMANLHSIPKTRVGVEGVDVTCDLKSRLCGAAVPQKVWRGRSQILDESKAQYLKSCELDPMGGNEYYAIETSELHQGVTFCYHVLLAAEEQAGHIKQDITDLWGPNKFSDPSACRADNFSPDITIGSQVIRPTLTQHEFVGGDNRWCNPRRERRGSIR